MRPYGVTDPVYNNTKQSEVHAIEGSSLRNTDRYYGLGKQED
jgi:hypothetical protein